MVTAAGAGGGSGGARFATSRWRSCGLRRRSGFTAFHGESVAAEAWHYISVATTAELAALHNEPFLHRNMTLLAFGTVSFEVIYLAQGRLLSINLVNEMFAIG